MIPSEINGAYIASTPISSIYSGSQKIWPIDFSNSFFWQGFSKNSCVNIGINTTQGVQLQSGVKTGLAWSDGGYTDINSGNFSYRYSFGMGSCTPTGLPTGIPNLYRWFDANDSTTLLNITGGIARQNQQVYTWLDKSINSGNLNKGTSLAGTVFAPILINNNGRNFVRFSSSGQMNGTQLSGTHDLSNKSLTYFIVYEWRNIHTTYLIDVLFTLGRDGGLGGQGNIGIGSQTTNESITLHGVTYDMGPVLTGVLKYSSLNYNSIGPKQEVYYNRLKIADTPTPNISAIDGQMALGSWLYEVNGRKSEYFADADIAELIIYSGSLTSGQTTVIQDYLNYKYGL